MFRGVSREAALTFPYPTLESSSLPQNEESSARMKHFHVRYRETEHEENILRNTFREVLVEYRITK
jgi:hypothetical protein